MSGVESILVDSNVFIDLLRDGRNPAMVLGDRFGSTDLVTCGVVMGEVLRGIKSESIRGKLEGFFDVMRYVDTSRKMWDDVWELAWALDREGKVLPLTDVVIACCALRGGSAVLTSDRHFDLIPGLVVLRPE